MFQLIPVSEYKTKLQVSLRTIKAKPGSHPSNNGRMASILGRLALLLWILGSFIVVVQGDFAEPPLDYSMRSLTEDETRLPCRYNINKENGEVVIQVTWTKEKPDGTKENIIAVVRSDDGKYEVVQYSMRVKFSSDYPTVDSSLIIMNTLESDDGTYNCKITVFPSGNFERQLSLTVWTTPISSLEPVTLVEGQSFRSAASCRSVAHPPPRISWDTDLPGESHNRTTGSRSIFSQFLLHPLRNMNGKKLDCLVWHPSKDNPFRITNNLVVYYPPNTKISGFDRDWHVGLEGATLKCDSEGNPKPQNFTWTWNGGEVPEGVITENEILKFNRPLWVTDAGLYECVAKNLAGAGKADVNITVSVLIVIVSAVAGVTLLAMIIIIVLVTHHHKRKNRKLERELNVKKEEISTLSRQASFRRINSISTDPRGNTEENLPLRVERGPSIQGTLRSSLSSLMTQEAGRIRDSSSTVIGGGLDYLGRPILHNSSRRGRESRAMDRDEENRLRVESYVRNSNMSLETKLHPPIHPSSFPMEQSAELRCSMNGSAIVPAEGSLHGRHRPSSRNTHAPVSANYPAVTDDEEEDEGVNEERRTNARRSPMVLGRPEEQGSENNSSPISDMERNNYFQQNGSLRPKTLPKAHPNPGSPPLSTHAIIIQKPQLV
ncbi:hypothetical protein UPYG_G00239630 [Umbra pygmaea]|uniref:Ig-like domain-containing protein n=1 Tax=Umbra pygmaea TaxID=75934 RepID=A0ABD0WF55_UMBPY